MWGERKINDEWGTPSRRVWGGDPWMRLQAKQKSLPVCPHTVQQGKPTGCPLQTFRKTKGLRREREEPSG